MRVKSIFYAVLLLAFDEPDEPAIRLGHHGIGCAKAIALFISGEFLELSGLLQENFGLAH